MKYYVNYLVEWIKGKVYEAHAEGVVLGVSGGIDSAVVAKLAKLAFPNNCLGLVLPCHSNPLDQQLAIELCNKFDIPYQVVDLTPTYETMINSFEKDFLNDNSKRHSDAKSNTKVRLRMTTIYAYAQSRNYLVLGTDNADEWYIGYFTKHGDGACDLAPIIHLTKGEVVELAKMFEVPEPIISRPPSAGLHAGQTDEQDIGVSYDELDKHVRGYEIDEVKKQRLLHLHKISEHKRNIPAHPKAK